MQRNARMYLLDIQASAAGGDHTPRRCHRESLATLGFGGREDAG